LYQEQDIHVAAGVGRATRRDGHVLNLSAEIQGRGAAEHSGAACNEKLDIDLSNA
jgi:hypothetical protein